MYIKHKLHRYSKVHFKSLINIGFIVTNVLWYSYLDTDSSNESLRMIITKITQMRGHIEWQCYHHNCRLHDRYTYLCMWSSATGDAHIHIPVQLYFIDFVNDYWDGLIGLVHSLHIVMFPFSLLSVVAIVAHRLVSKYGCVSMYKHPLMKMNRPGAC